mmetsp:Transcript_15164/g.23407  ORF Transcript_15164/g.23407 Transcript_15164/m.23407 type:complete len:98 (+) Transcript_15164:1295-1588(+)
MNNNSPSQFYRGSPGNSEFRASIEVNKLARKTTVFQKNLLDDFTAFGRFKGKALAPSEDAPQKKSSFANSPKVKQKATGRQQSKEGGGFSELILKTI